MCPSVCLSVRYGRSAEVIWPRDTGGSISGPQAVQAKTRRSLQVPATVLATCTNTSTSFLDGLYITRQQTGTYIQWPAVNQAALLVRRYCPSGHHGGSRFWLWLLGFSSLTRGATSELTTFLESWLIQPCAQTGCHKCACSKECSRTQVKGSLNCLAHLQLHLQTSTLDCSLRRVVLQCTIIVLITDMQHSGEMGLFSIYTIFYKQLCT